MGCLRSLFSSIFSTTKNIIIFGVVVAAMCVGLVFLIQAGEEAATNEAVDELNEGRGTQDEPIAAGTFMKFEEGQVRAVRMQRPASISVGGDDPPAGAEWVAVWFEVTCEKQECHERELDLQLVDTEENEWSEPLIVFVDDFLDEAVEGATMEGWQVFEVSQTAELELLKVKWGSVTLYQEIPPTE